jgi:hypothetical protein
MSYIYDYFDNYMEVWAAVVFGVLAVGACIAVAAALNGVM